MTTDMTDSVKRTIRYLRKNGFDARYCKTRDEARNIILEMIPAGATVGVADSVTLRQTRVLEELLLRGNEVINPFTPELTPGAGSDEAKVKLFHQTLRRTFGTDVFITGCNALTEDGKVVSIDGAGNRVAGMIYGAPKVILTVGTNKIVKDVETAIERIKNVIAPVHARQKNYNTPCAKTGKCADCSSKQRICSVTVVLEKKTYHADLSVILIDEDLGLSWTPSWDKARIDAIVLGYLENSWPF